MPRLWTEVLTARPRNLTDTKQALIAPGQMNKPQGATSLARSTVTLPPVPNPV